MTSTLPPAATEASPLARAGDDRRVTVAVLRRWAADLRDLAGDAGAEDNQPGFVANAERLALNFDHLADEIAMQLRRAGRLLQRVP